MECSPNAGRDIVKVKRTPSRVLLATGAGILFVAGVLGWFGVPAVSSQGIVIRSHFLEGDIPNRPSDTAWEAIAPIPIPLSGQIITRPVWPEPSAKVISVRSVHDGTHISFLMEWQDATKNERLTPGVFRDGAALALPLGDAPAFFCMGQLDHYVNIWHWKADWQSDVDRRKAKAKEKKRSKRGIRRFEVIPRRPSSIEDLIGGGFSTLTSKIRQGKIKGEAEWKSGFWRVVMKRPLTQSGDDTDNEAVLVPGRIQAVSFAVWNGENKERNGQKGVASWLQLLIDPVGGPK